jgi:hypothetical protein
MHGVNAEQKVDMTDTKRRGKTRSTSDRRMGRLDVLGMVRI